MRVRNRLIFISIILRINQQKNQYSIPNKKGTNMYNKYSYKHNCLPTIDAESIVESVITKMKYTCDNPYCKHRIIPTGRTYGDQRQYNRQRKSKSKSAGKINRDRQSCLCLNRSADNPEQQQYHQNTYANKRSPYKNHQHCFSRFCNSYTHPAGDYQPEQQRGRWINNSLHNGYTMKKILYQSQNPRARIQSGPFAKNYDSQYQIAQSRIMNTRATSPQRRSKIATLVRRDRERSK